MSENTNESSGSFGSVELTDNTGSLSGNFELWWNGVVSLNGKHIHMDQSQLDELKGLFWSAFLTGADVAMSCTAKSVLRELDVAAREITSAKQ